MIIVDTTHRELETSFGRMRLELFVTVRKLKRVVVGRKCVDRSCVQWQVVSDEVQYGVSCYHRLHYLWVQQSLWWGRPSKSMIGWLKWRYQHTGHDCLSLRDGGYDWQGIGNQLWKNEIGTLCHCEKAQEGGGKRKRPLGNWSGSCNWLYSLIRCPRATIDTSLIHSMINQDLGQYTWLSLFTLLWFWALSQGTTIQF